MARRSHLIFIRAKKQLSTYYKYLDTTLPTNASCPGTIHAGDILLYGNNCVVVFYKTFNTSYSYTKIGKITDPTGLEAAVGAGGVEVQFGH